MIKLRLSIKGDKVVSAKLQKGQAFRKELAPYMKESVLYVHSRVPSYPAPPSGSTYVRTGTLGRSVTSMLGQAEGALAEVRPLSGGVVGVVGSSVKYAPYVIDRKRQAWMHKGRWYVLQDVVEKARPGIKKILEKGINKILNG